MACFAEPLGKLLAGSAELTPTFFLYDDIATPAGPHCKVTAASLDCAEFRTHSPL